MSELLMSILAALLIGVWVPLACMVAYLLFLTAVAALPRRRLPEAESQRHFRIVIPAHDEELVLEPVLRRLLSLQYPRTHFDVVVIADNCSDRTAQVAQALGARVLQRHNLAARGKGHALAHAFSALQREQFDAYVVLDADTLVDPMLLMVLNRYLAAGHRVVQAHYDVLNPFESRRTTLMYVALRIFHYVRPLGRCKLGLSATLTGNGMCFAKGVIDRYTWSAYSLTEDLEYTSLLIHNGERVVFAPEAHIRAQMPTTRAQAASQRMRWEAGRLQIARRDGLRSLWHGVWRLNPCLVDWGLELLIPPLAVLTLAIMGGTVIAMATAAFSPTAVRILLLWAWLILPAALLLFLFLAMIVGRVPRQAYGAMLSAPGYVLWKLWIYLVMLTRRAPQQWVRTDRVRIHHQ